MKVYLDNGATTKVSDEVVKAMLPYFTRKYGNAESLHDFGQEALKALEDSRKIIAKKINASPEEIIFTSGGTESNNLAIKGYVYANKEKGNHIITSKFEHPAVLNTCKTLEREGFRVTYLNITKKGIVDLEELANSINDKTILVSIMHANNEIGTIQDLYKISRICKEKNIALHTDAVQSFTKVPIDVKRYNLDLVSFSAHKIHGPKGVGALYIKKGTKIKKLFDGGPHEYNIRPTTHNIPGIVGFAKAAELIKEKDIKNMEKLRNYLIRELLKIPYTQLNGDLENRLCNNVNISFNFIEGESLLLYLNQKGIAVSTGSACSSHDLKPSHVLMALGLKHEIAHGTIRFTLSKYTIKKELDYTISEVKKAVEKLRKISPLTK